MSQEYFDLNTSTLECLIPVLRVTCFCHGASIDICLGVRDTRRLPEEND